VKGIEKSLSAQQKLDAKIAEARQLRTPREKIEALRDIKNAEIAEQNAEHRARCEATRDQILSNMRARMAQKS
jgi:hypothetical protein